LDFSEIKTFSIKDRIHKVKLSHLGSIPGGESFADFYDSLPRLLGSEDLHVVARAIAVASQKKHEVILAMGAHPIKCGLSPLIINLMEQRIITSVALNGAGSIHDFEMAFIGETSEDVAQTLRDGSFGMVEETGRILNQVMAGGCTENRGAGESIGGHILNSGYPNANLSIQAAGVRLGIDVTVHIAIGTDTIHIHPDADGAVLGKATHLDFMKYAGHISKLDKGVYINLGSAVVLPEVFLKALSAVRNMGYEVLKFTTVNMDMLRHYRPSENVLRRPEMTGAKAINLTGQHEIMLPLLAAAIMVEKGRLT
jgi:hypothetical protein